MVRIPPQYYKKRLQTILSLLDIYNCDCLLIYNAEKEDPPFLPWILGNRILDTTLLLVKKGGIYIFIPQWRLDEAKSFYNNFECRFVGTPEKDTMINSIISHLKDVQTIGFAGNLPYKEYLVAKKKKFINIEESLRKMCEVKDAIELNILQKAKQFTIKLINTIPWQTFIGKSELELSMWIENMIKNKGFLISHLGITSGPMLKKTTASLPSNYKIKTNDVVCIDFGVEMQTYRSDITRCHFLGKSKNKYYKYYELLQNIIRKTSSKIVDGTLSKNIFGFFKNEFKNHSMTSFFVPRDLGHGIGTGCHEYPEIGFGDYVLKKGNVFTLEPEAKMSDGTYIRYEDMFYINDSGRCRSL